MLSRMGPSSVLFVTLDSCRYDTFLAADAPHMKAVGELRRALAPANFTLASHAAMFVGFTPSVPSRREPYVNPKWARLFKLDEAGFPGRAPPFFSLNGRTIIEGFKNKGYAALGTGALGWFDRATPVGRWLTQDFDEFFFPGSTYRIDKQLEWALSRLRRQDGRPTFLFLNIGETHVPYHYRNAPWKTNNPCESFGAHNDAHECRRRQVACIEHVDAMLADLLDLFSAATILLCSDHGDCWGEDGLWEHGCTHPAVMEVPLLIRLGQAS